jgi:hypothetical protein
MADPASLPDWITATATAATALAASIAGLIAWLAFRRDVRASLPIIEADFAWADTNCIAYIWSSVINYMKQSLSIR